MITVLTFKVTGCLKANTRKKKINTFMVHVYDISIPQKYPDKIRATNSLICLDEKVLVCAPE